MKIPDCYNELDNFTYNPKTKKIRFKKTTMYYILKSECNTCKEEYFAKYKKDTVEYCSNSCKKTGKSHHYYNNSISSDTKNKISNAMSGKVRTKDHCNNLSISLKNRFKVKELHPSWRGGISINKLSLYETYSHQIYFCESTRKSPDNELILEVRCTYCNKWYKPKASEVYSRIQSIKGKADGEHRFYCSDGCKDNCDIFRQQKYPKGYKINKYSREVQPSLRKLVLERDNWKCQKCGDDKYLQCHHIDPVINNPESADVDNCITLCKKCHKSSHKKDGCGYNELKCKEV